MAELLLVDAVNDALHVEMERDPSVLVMGEDVGRLGGVFRATAGLQDRFGPERCIDTPLAEAGILGTAVGLCMAGWRPVWTRGPATAAPRGRRRRGRSARRPG